MEKNKKKTFNRMKWIKSIDFIFSCVGAIVGLGNIWRFPYLCYKNGGGAFLVPYLLSAIFIGFPLNYLEISFGQMVHKGLLKTWGMVPIMKGIAFCNLMVLAYNNISYPIILTWILKYFLASFNHILPWTTCNNTWNTENCYDYESSGNKTFSVYSERNVSSDWNIDVHNNTNNESLSASEEYLKYRAWGMSDGINNLGSLRGDLTGCLAVVWILVFLAVFRGIKWSAKIVYVTAIAPIVLIFVVLIKGMTLEGASLGIKYYLLPDINKIMNAKVWIEACTQVLYSNAVVSGALLTMGSYNNYHHNFQRDSLIIVSCNCLTSFIGGFAVFTVLGFMASSQNLTVEEIATSGPGLVFVTYPQALSFLPLANIWCVIFFLMLLLLGYDSQYVYVESTGRFFIDNIPQLNKSKTRHSFVYLFISIISFLLGLVMVTEGGVYVFEIFIQYGCAGWCLYLAAACEFIAVGWCYGADRYLNKVEDMIGSTWLRTYISLIWRFAGPIICLLVTAFYLGSQNLLKTDDYIYPFWAQCFANVISVSTFISIPAVAFYMIVIKKLSWLQLLGREKEKHKTLYSEKEQTELHLVNKQIYDD